MLRRFSINFALFSIVLDGFLVVISLLLADFLRPALSRFSFAQPLAAGEVIVPPALYMSFPLIWIAVLLLFNVYDGRRNLRLVDEMSAVTLGSGLAAIASAGLLFLSFRDVSRMLFASFVFIAFALLVAWRLLLRSLQLRGFQKTEHRVLVIGAGEIGQQLRAQPLLVEGGGGRARARIREQALRLGCELLPRRQLALRGRIQQRLIGDGRPEQ